MFGVDLAQVELCQVCCVFKRVPAHDALPFVIRVDRHYAHVLGQNGSNEVVGVVCLVIGILPKLDLEVLGEDLNC